MTGLPTLTVRQPWASLIAMGAKTIETRSRSTTHRGRLAIHAATGVGHLTAGSRTTIGEYEVERDAAGLLLRGPIAWPYRLPLGAIVATVDVVGSVPMVGALDDDDPIPHAVVIDDYGGVGALTLFHDGDPFGLDVTRQAPLGVFRPGDSAWLLDDAKPTTARCPWCLGAENVQLEESFCPASQRDDHQHCACSWVHDVCHWCRIEWLGDGAWRCPACAGAGTCDPIAARGRLGLWRWEPAT